MLGIAGTVDEFWWSKSCDVACSVQTFVEFDFFSTGWILIRPIDCLFCKHYEYSYRKYRGKPGKIEWHYFSWLAVGEVSGHARHGLAFVRRSKKSITHTSLGHIHSQDSNFFLSSITHHIKLASHQVLPYRTQASQRSRKKDSEAKKKWKTNITSCLHPLHPRELPKLR